MAVAKCFQDASGVATISDLPCLIERIISPLPGLIALAAVGMIIFAGIRIITAGSDPKAYASAISTFQWAIIGLILLLVAWLILVMIKNFTGADVTNFGLPV
jgi:hypothetical protein